MNSGSTLTGGLLFDTVSQTETKQRFNTDKLIKFLISYPYYEEKSCLLDTKPVPNEFQDYYDYKSTFEVIFPITILIESLLL